MVFSIIGRALVAWLSILLLAVANGALREVVLIPLLGMRPGFIISGILLSAIILVVAYFSLPWFGQKPVATYIAIGSGWLLLTLIFEFIFGHFILDKTWPQLFEAYTFKNGNIWPVELLSTAVAPYLAAKIKGWA